jgi:large subunit ribosomal protein L6
MSRIGKMPVEIPQGVTVSIEGNIVKVASSKGELEQIVSPNLQVETKDNQVIITKTVDDLYTSGLYGLTEP